MEAATHMDRKSRKDFAKSDAKVRIVSEAKPEHTKANAANEIKERHVATARVINIANVSRDDLSVIKAGDFEVSS